MRKRKPIPHGTVNAYNNRACRCVKCKMAARLYYKKYRALTRRRSRKARRAA